MSDKDRIVTKSVPGDYLFDESLTHLLIVGDLPSRLAPHLEGGVSVQQLASLDEAENYVMPSNVDNDASDEKVHALVLGLDPDEAQFEQTLGRAVRAFPYRILLHCTTTEAMPGRGDDAFFAFGFRKLQVRPNVLSGDNEPSVTVKWFEYRLSQYKPAPDWLNAQFWANPDRFDADGDLDDYCDESEYDEEE